MEPTLLITNRTTAITNHLFVEWVAVSVQEMAWVAVVLGWAVEADEIVETGKLKRVTEKFFWSFSVFCCQKIAKS
jgi:hypothetical protein